MCLVIVSNRVPGPDDQDMMAGGLAVALREALHGDVLWLGWSGEVKPSPSREPKRYSTRSVQCATLDISQDEY
jgi:trehalose 6-phosphate synthase